MLSTRDQIGGGNGSSWRVRPNVRRVARRLKASEGAGPGPSGQDRFIEGVHRIGQEEDCSRSGRSLPCAGGSDDSSGQCAIRRTPGWFVWQPSSSRSSTGKQCYYCPCVILGKSWPRCVFRCSNYSGKTQICVLNCTRGHVAKKRERHQQTARWTWGRVFTRPTGFQNPLAVVEGPKAGEGSGFRV